MTVSDDTAEILDGIGFQDHSICSEYRIFGPPGTGKTTNLTRQIRRAVDRFGDNSALVTSFSRATSVELTGRDVPIDPDRIGTLHSHCFHALGKPDIAEVHVDDWNRRYPGLKITPISRQIRLDGEDGVEDDRLAKDGDHVLHQLNRCRGTMLGPESWPAVVRDFASKWNRYKTANRLLDFCDLIETSLRDVNAAPNHPAVLIVDEAQDLNRLQLTLIRSWSERAQYLVLAGDDDQTIYAWAGASPDAILDPDIPADHKIFLKQSQRVPRQIQAVTDRLIHQVTRRQEKSYQPRPSDGAVHRLANAGYRSPEYGILKSAEQHFKEGKTVMFLASCSYMLRPLIAILRKNAIPFHNPHRKNHGCWNPLRLGSRGSAARRILSLLGAHPAWGDQRRPWTHGEMLSWTEWLAPRGILNERTTGILKSADKSTPVTGERLAEIFHGSALNSPLDSYATGYLALLNWWRTHIAAEFRARTKYPADIAARRGPAGLVDQPRVVVGTIHSVKGGQADVVYLFPDLSKAGDEQYQQRGPERDSVIRTFYVGATRARETLYICSRESGMAVSV